MMTKIDLFLIVINNHFVHALTISEKAGLREAPPTRNPSTSSIENNY